MNTLPIPEGSINHPSLPLPWRPSERSEITTTFFMDNAKTMPDVREYTKKLQDRYVITDIGVFAVEASVGYTSIGSKVFGRTERTERDPYEVQAEFEQDVLGLQPANSSDGLRFYVSRAGFSGGTYPIEPFADLVGSSVEDLRTILKDGQGTKFGHVILKSANFLVPVKIDRHNTSFVHADMVTELSDQGNALVDTALFIADHLTQLKTQ